MPSNSPQTESYLPSFTKEMGERIKQVVTILGGYGNAAKIAGVSQEQVSRWRHGRSKPAFLGLARLAFRAGISLDWLASGQGPMSIQDKNTVKRTGAGDMNLPLLYATVFRIEKILEDSHRTLTADKKALLTSSVYLIAKDMVGEPSKLDQDYDEVLNSPRFRQLVEMALR